MVAIKAGEGAIEGTTGEAGGEETAMAKRSM